MSKETKAALIGAAATIIAAIIGGIFLLRTVSGSSTGVPTATTNPTTPIVSTTQTTETQPSTQQPSPQGTHTVDTAGATSKIDSFCQLVNSGALQQAYNLTSSNYQSQHDISQFTSQFNNSDLSHGGCLHNQPMASANNVIVTLIMNRINLTDGSTSSTSYVITLVRDSQSGFWVIEVIQLQ